MFGMGKQADELTETMNHAAENAVAEARPILSESIKKMSVDDAKGILTGGEGSVTKYFKRTSSEQLTEKFTPIVKASTKKLQLAEQYNQFAGKAASSGLIDKKDAELVDHNSSGSSIERLVAGSHRLETLRRRKSLVPLHGDAVSQIQPVDIARLESALDAGVIRGSNCRRVVSDFASGNLSGRLVV